MLNPALYYPYIHFRDLNWLKASLLCFQQVRRIVPLEFALNDSDEVRALREQEGADKEPLIREEAASGPAVDVAQGQLLKRLQAQPPKFLNRFILARAEQEYPSGGHAFEMHRGKMEPLVNSLRSHQLAWPATTMRQRKPDDWLALHPKLGEAIMSTIAIAIAKDNGLGIVTSSGDVHRALARQSEDLAFQMLTDKSLPDDSGAPPETMADDFAMTVLVSGFDVSKLNAKQIGELVREGKDLSAFKKRLDEELEGARQIPNPKERQRRLKAAAAEIVAEWKRQQKKLPKYALNALVPLAGADLSIASGVIAGAATMTVLSAGVGLAIGLAAYAGVNAWQSFQASKDHPLNYLSKIHRAGATLVSHV